jgi:hypothetical protein
MNFAVVTPSGVPYNDIVDAISTFYLNLAGGLGAVHPMYEYLSGIVDNTAGNGLTLRAYDISSHLDGTPHGSPAYVESYTVPASTLSERDLPSECATAITLEGLGRAAAPVEIADDSDPDSAPERPKQRHTGKLYFGPLNTGTVELVSSIPRVKASYRDDAIAATKNCAANVAAIGTGAALCVWSRVDAALRPLEAVSIDNAFDIMNSRGEKPSVRQRALVP